MRISAKADYAVRAVVEVAAAGEGAVVPAETLARRQAVPGKFLEAILADLRRGGVLTGVRGAAGGYRLTRPAQEVSVADIVRAVDGPLVSVRGERPPDLEYAGPTTSLLPLWVALRACVRRVLETVTVAHLLDGALPEDVTALTHDPQAWENP